jgi:hypothetical protein
MPWTKKKSINKKVWRFLFGAGIWDSWGLGLSNNHYSKAITIEFIHFYFWIEYWTKQEALEAKEREEHPSD